MLGLGPGARRDHRRAAHHLARLRHQAAAARGRHQHRERADRRPLRRRQRRPASRAAHRRLRAVRHHPGRQHARRDHRRRAAAPAPGRTPDDAPRRQPRRRDDATFRPVLDADAPPQHPRPGLGKPTAEESFTAGRHLGRRAARWPGWSPSGCSRSAAGPGSSSSWLVLGILVTIVTGLDDRAPRRRGRPGRQRPSSPRGALVVGAALVSTVGFVVFRGWEPLLHLNFFVDDMSGVGPRDPFDRGGIAHAIVGSAIELGIAIAVTLPLGIGTAVFMTEVGGRFAGVVRTIVEAMTALPSIVAGLFIYTVLIVGLGFPRSGFAAAMALSVMMLPIIARAADVVLRVVPGGLREASLALGASRWRTVWHVVLPDRAPRPGHRRHPRRRPRRRRDVAGAAHRGVGDLHGHQPDRRRHELAAALHLQGRPQPRADGHRARLRRRDGAADPRARPLRRRPPRGAHPHHGPSPERASPAPPHRHPQETHEPPPQPAPGPADARPAARGSSTGAVAPCGRRPPGAGPACGVRTDRGLGLDLVRGDRPAVDLRRRRARHEGHLQRRWLHPGPQELRAERHRLRHLRDPLPGRRRVRQRRQQQRPRVRLPADRRGRHGVHLPAQDRQRAGPQPAPVRRDGRQDLHRPDHRLERPGDHQGQQRPRLPQAADHPGRPLRRLRHDGAVHHLAGRASTRRSGGPTSAARASRPTTRARAGCSPSRAPTR